MTYTLFVDESGDFEHHRRRSGWVVSGVLRAGKRKAAEDAVKAAVSGVAATEGLKTPGDIHLTELRREWGEAGRVSEFAGRLLEAARQDGARLFAVVNRSGVEMWEPEQTYRLMLLDLVALVDASAPADMDRLDLVIAQRKRYKAEERMSTKDELLADVVDRVRDGVQAGLAARGLVERLDGGACVVWKAAGSWGLAAADAVANLTYNRRHQESRDVLDALRSRGGYQDFEAFGAYAERRARVAERDGDLAGAAARWALLPPGEAQAEGLGRVWAAASVRGAMAPWSVLEGAVDLVYHGPAEADRVRGYEALSSSLEAAEAAPALTYRVRDMLHLLANRRGDLERASSLGSRQRSADPAVAADPASLPLVFKSLFHRMTTAELRLDFGAVLDAARAQADAVAQYGVVTEMLADALNVDGGGAGYERSRLSIKGQTSLARGLILVGGEEALAEAEGVLDHLAVLQMGEEDAARVACYRIWAAVRAADTERALERAVAAVTDYADDPFALALGARAAADAHVVGGRPVEGAVGSLLDAARSVGDGAGYPYDVLWRDVAALDASQSARAAQPALRASRVALDAGAASPATRWKAYGLELVEASARAPDGPPPPPPEGLSASGLSAGGATARRAHVEYRRRSPY